MKMIKVVTIVLASLFLTMLFSNIAISGSGNGYDPWVDLNDDGNIDYNDLYTFARAYGSSGTPINKTALLLELLSRIDSLNASLIALESRVEALETSLATIRKPDYDSGWVDKTIGGQYFVHNLGTTEVFVYVLGRFWASGYGWMVHQRSYGGDEYWEPFLQDWRSFGIEVLEMNENSINIFKYADDLSWQQVRVMIWKL